MEKREKIDKKLLKRNIKKLWQYVKIDKKFIIIFIILTVIRTGIGVVLPLISAKVILNLSTGLFDELLMAAFILLIINLIDMILRNLVDYCNEHIGNTTRNSLQIDLAREFLKLEISEIDKSSTGTLSEMINYEANNLSYVIFRFIYNITDILSKIGVVVTVFILNKYIFAYFLILAIINFIISEIRNQVQEKHWQKERKAREEKYSIISELIRGIRDIKVLNANKTIMKVVDEKITNVTRETVASNNSYRKFSVITSIIRQIANFGFYVLGIILCNFNLLTASTFLILYNYRGNLDNLFGGITSFSEDLREFNFNAKRVFDVIYGDNFKKETFGDKKLKQINGYIEFRDVTFSYTGKKDVIKNVSFKINPNETVGFVGKSGSGKSTLFSLLTKLYNVNKGSILIDGININELDETTLRGNISIITQSPYIFNFSIKNNLLLASPKASMKDIRKACKLAMIDDFIMELDEKYDTILGENGIILSGGQKQRLAIARALLMNTEIMLFDEATSALDNETQDSIQEAIHNLKGKYTILIIAHRLSTVLDNDKIFVIDNGKVVGEGTHKKLMKENKIYQNLYKKEVV